MARTIKDKATFTLWVSMITVVSYVSGAIAYAMYVAASTTHWLRVGREKKRS